MRNFSRGCLQPFISVSAPIFGCKRSHCPPALSGQSAHSLYRPLVAVLLVAHRVQSDVGLLQAYVDCISGIFSILTSIIYPAFGQIARRALHTQTSAAPTGTLSTALSAISSQPMRYVVASVAGRKYLLAPRDLLTVPRLNDVKVGDVLALSEIHEVGSREFTLRGNPIIPAEQVKVEATVVEHTKGKMEVIFKKKRRKGYEKTITHKQTYTRLSIGPIDVAEQIA